MAESHHSTPSIVHRLRLFYDQSGISALDFRCKHFDHCSADSPDFVTAQETYVGPDYGDGMPRLLFLSLDSGSLNPDPAARTMESVRRRVLTNGMGPKGRHWYETHRLALTLLEPFDRTLRIERTSRFFAHMNAAKCCQNKDGNAKADSVLFGNCREYVGDEIRILNPDVLVTQGREARQAVERHFGNAANQLVRPGSDDAWGVLRLDESQRTVWFPTHHPRYYAKFWKQADESWSVFKQVVLRHMDGTLADTEVSGAPAVSAVTATDEPGGDAYVWVNSQDGWVIHGGPRSSFARAVTVANLLARRKGWQTHAGHAKPPAVATNVDAPSRVVAMTSPVHFD